MPTSVDAQQAALDAYNVAVDALNNAQAQLDTMSARPSDTDLGHDAGGKEWDRDHAAVAKKLEDARSEAAQASKQYATILTQQAAQEATDASPGAQARAQRAQAQADYYHARADGLAAHDAAAQQSAQTRADAALTRANSANDRVSAQNEKDTASADASRASAEANRANVDKTRAEIANMQSPAQAQSDRIAQIRASAQAQVQAAFDAKKALVVAGIEMPERDQMELKQQLDSILAETQSSLRSAEAEASFERDKPFKERDAAVGERNAATAEQNATTSATQVENNRVAQDQTSRQRQIDTQTGVLAKQGEQGQSALAMLIKEGVRPSMASLRAAEAPYQYASYISGLAHSAVASGELSTTPPASPTPPPLPAPATAAAPALPVPAGAVPPAAPISTDASVPVPRRPGFVRPKF